MKGQYNKALSEIAWKGSFLFERLNLEDKVSINKNISLQEENEINEKVNRWQESILKENFEKMIYAEDLTNESIKFVCSDLTWREDLKLPVWVESLEKIMSLFPAKVKDGKNIYDILIPIVDHFHGIITAKIEKHKDFFCEKVYTSMKESLYKRLVELFDSTLSYKFDAFIKETNTIANIMGTRVLSKDQRQTYIKKFNDYLNKEGLKKILMEYPVLSRLLVHTIESFAKFVLKLIDDYSKERLQLNETYGNHSDLGKVLDMKFDISNLHDNGKASCIFEFKNKKLLYKPRSTNVNQSWTSFISAVNQSNPKYRLLSLESLDYTTHGWTEYLDPKPLKEKKDAEKFYYRTGVLMGLFYVLGGNDFHCEKLIAYNAHPIIIDFETLLMPRVEPFNINQKGYSASEKAVELLSDSVLRLGMLPAFVSQDNGSIKDVSSLTGSSSSDICSNALCFNGERLDPREFIEDIIEGFHFAYYLFQTNKKIIEKAVSVFRNCKCRFLIRDSEIYKKIIKRISHPSFLKDAFDYSIEIEKMSLAYLSTAHEELKDIWPIFCSERKSLTFRDVPLFYSQPCGNALLDSKEVVYNRYFSVSGIMHAKQIIEGLGHKDYTLQVSLISNALSSHKDEPSEDEIHYGNTYETFVNCKVSVDDILSEAFSIYRTILDNRISVEKDYFTFVAPVNDVKFKYRRFSEVGTNLYDGTLGVGLFFAMLYSVTNDQVVKEYALDTVKELRELIIENKFPIKQLNLGIAKGVSGYIIGLYNMGVYLQDESLITDAVSIFNSVTDYMIRAESNLNLISGSAGIILAASLMKDIANKEKVLDIVKVSADKISTFNLKQTGTAYGMSGISLALAKAYEMTCDETYLETAGLMITKENKGYSDQHKNWCEATNKDSNKYKVGWSNGAPGIGLSRISSMKVLDSDKIIKDINNACEFALKVGVNGPDQLSCGVCSRIELLVEAGGQLNNTLYLDNAMKLAWQMVCRKNSIGHYCLDFNNDNQYIFNPSLFQGLSGIGYALLRCAFPDKIKSILI